MNTRVFRSDALAGKVALVTGGGTGIGRATALALAAAGASIFLAGRRSELLAETQARIVAAGGEAGYRAGDLREAAEPEALVGAVLETYGRIDILVNNAGGQFAAPAAEISGNGWEAVYRLSVSAAWNLTRTAFRRSFRPQRSGLVVFLAFAPTKGLAGMVHATSARAALRQLASDLAGEWSRYGVRSITIAPGLIATDGLSQYTPAAVSAWTDGIPMRRLGTPEEVADVIVFCASDAARYLSGITIPVDGGADAWGAGHPVPTELQGGDDDP